MKNEGCLQHFRSITTDRFQINSKILVVNARLKVGSEIGVPLNSFICQAKPRFSTYHSPISTNACLDLINNVNSFLLDNKVSSVNESDRRIGEKG